MAGITTSLILGGAAIAAGLYATNEQVKAEKKNTNKVLEQEKLVAAEQERQAAEQAALVAEQVAAQKAATEQTRVNTVNSNSKEKTRSGSMAKVKLGADDTDTKTGAARKRAKATKGKTVSNSVGGLGASKALGL